jgi:hypothetical protein
MIVTVLLLQFTSVISLVRDILLILATIAGGIWAFYKFRKMRIPEARLQIEMRCEVFQSDKRALIDTVIDLRNTGNAAIWGKIPGNPECNLEVKKIPEKLTHEWISPTHKDLRSLLPAIEFLKPFESWYPEEPFLLEPGTTESLHAIFSTTEKGLIYLKCGFVDREDNLWTAEKIIQLK